MILFYSGDMQKILILAAVVCKNIFVINIFVIIIFGINIFVIIIFGINIFWY